MEVSEKKWGSPKSCKHMYQFSIETHHNLGIPHVKNPPYDIWLCLKMGYTSKIPFFKRDKRLLPTEFWGTPFSD